MPLLLLLARVKVSDGNLRKEIEGELKNPEENPGQILWELSFGLLTKDIVGSNFRLTCETFCNFHRQCDMLSH